MTNPSLSKYLPTKSDEDGLLDGFLKWAEDSEIDLYPAQEEAVLEFFGGQHVILTTPTGSGKSFNMAKVFEATNSPSLILATNNTLAAPLFGEYKSFFTER